MPDRWGHPLDHHHLLSGMTTCIHMRSRTLIRALITLVLALHCFVWTVPETALAEYKGMLSGDKFMELVSHASSQVVVVNFWATWCGPCRQEFPALMALRKQYNEKELFVMGISLDYNPGAVKFFADKVGFNYPIYVDGGEIAPAFKVTAIPRILVFVDGKLEASHVGYMSETSLNSLIKPLISSVPSQQVQKKS